MAGVEISSRGERASAAARVGAWGTGCAVVAWPAGPGTWLGAWAEGAAGGALPPDAPGAVAGALAVSVVVCWCAAFSACSRAILGCSTRS